MKPGPGVNYIVGPARCRKSRQKYLPELEVPSLRTTVHTTSRAANLNRLHEALSRFRRHVLAWLRGRRRGEQLSGSFQRKLDRSSVVRYHSTDK
jgi:hypothetical protein